MPMECCQCQAIESLFNLRTAKWDLKRYRERGPAKTTRVLVEALRREGVTGETLLDIGGGVGAIQLALLHAGASSATDVDASAAYIQVARSEAEREGYGDRVQYVHGNFLEAADEISPAGIVTLERVICCFPDMPGMVERSAERAGKLYGLIYPRDTWWMRFGAMVGNLALHLRRPVFHFYVHRTPAVEEIVHRAGLERRFTRNVGIWQVAIYARAQNA
ncbi:MAG: class I SAM-dependent methyltransferase [Ktedonobacterales bacterium]